MPDFCTCGSILREGKCTNGKRNCPNGTRRRPVVKDQPGFMRSTKDGTIIDKETGVAFKHGGSHG